MALIYKLTFMNGKSYIGLTLGTAQRRFKGHADAAKGGSDTPCHKAWRALGKPDMIVLAECPDDLAFQTEIDEIRQHNTMLPHGYNVLSGGQMSPMRNPEIAARVAAKKTGVKHSEEARLKMSASHTGRKHTPETIAKMSAWQKGKPKIKASEDAKKKMSAAHKARWDSPGYRQRMSEIHTGKKRGPHSEEVKALMSANRKGKISPEGEERRKAAQIAAVKGKQLSDEQKLRLSEIRKLWWANKRASM